MSSPGESPIERAWRRARRRRLSYAGAVLLALAAAGAVYLGSARHGPQQRTTATVGAPRPQVMMVWIGARRLRARRLRAAHGAVWVVVGPRGRPSVTIR